MRRAWAAFLLMCLWVSIPAGAVSIRVCLLDGSSPTKAAWAGVEDRYDCCDDCDGTGGSGTNSSGVPPCCVDLEKLPDSALPQMPAGLPPVVNVAVVSEFLFPCANLEEIPGRTERVVLMRGRASPAAYRAVLEVWGI